MPGYAWKCICKSTRYLRHLLFGTHFKCSMPSQVSEKQVPEFRAQPRTDRHPILLVEEVEHSFLHGCRSTCENLPYPQKVAYRVSGLGRLVRASPSSGALRLPIGLAPSSRLKGLCTACTPRPRFCAPPSRYFEQFLPKRACAVAARHPCNADSQSLKTCPIR